MNSSRRELTLKSEQGNPLFGFKLHQFFSQGKTIYSSLESPESRHLTLEGQYYAPGEETVKASLSSKILPDMRTGVLRCPEERHRPPVPSF